MFLTFLNLIKHKKTLIIVKGLNYKIISIKFVVNLNLTGK
jgi:hypothetical protein